jgi:hypothetical protein
MNAEQGVAKNRILDSTWIENFQSRTNKLEALVYRGIRLPGGVVTPESK